VKIGMHQGLRTVNPALLLWGGQEWPRQRPLLQRLVHLNFTQL